MRAARLFFFPNAARAKIMEQMDMLASEDTDRPEEFSGTLERVVFHNEENGWTVFRLRVEGREDPVCPLREGGLRRLHGRPGQGRA